MRFLRRVVRAAPLWIAAALLVFLFARRLALSPRHEPFDFDPDRTYRVARVVDGDTLLLDNGERVRLLGVDTPETKHPDRPVEPLGVEAAAFTQRFVAGGVVRLEFDRERRDVHRRVLAYASVDGRSLNEELIRAGYSRAQTAFPYRDAMKKRFVAAEAEAREARRGLWQLSEE